MSHAELERGGTMSGCTCGNGGHPRYCVVHPDARAGEANCQALARYRRAERLASALREIETESRRVWRQKHECDDSAGRIRRIAERALADEPEESR